MGFPQKKYKKVGFWRTTYPKSTYLCSVLIKQLIVLRFKSKENEKLVLMAVAIVAVSFASCGNKAANAEQATADSIRIADSIAAVEAAAAEAAASVADTTATDSAAVVAE